MQPPTTKMIAGYKNKRIREKNIQVILQAAEKEFVVSGYKGASIRDIAQRAGLPKANVHYYFNSKVELYRAVLNNIMDSWLSVFNGLNPGDDPATALRDFIEAKIKFCSSHPNASRILSSEILHGGLHIKEHLRPFNDWIAQKTKVINGWIEHGKMKHVDSVHLLFTILASTQYYIDYEPQVASVLGKERLSQDDIEVYSESLCQLILKGCEIE